MPPQVYTVEQLVKARKLSRRRKFQGLDISVETQRGAYRYWYDPHAGRDGRTRMPFDYGYIRRTMGADGEHVDCYIGPDPDATHAYVIDQMKAPDFQVFDEQKVFLGFESAAEAKTAYLKCYDKPGFFGGIRSVPMGEFRKQVLSTTKEEPLVRSSRPRLMLRKAGGDTRLGLQKARYTKRIPTGDPKRPYRYVYAESAVARDVKRGEHIRLGLHVAQVLSVTKAGTVTIVLDGVKMTLPPTQWDNMLAGHYGKKYFAWAERRSRQSVNAVLRLVPREMLKDLDGTDAQRMEQLKVRAPEVYAKLDAAFQRAGVNPFRAKRMLSAVLRRRGWKPEARAAVIGAVMEHRDHGHNQLIAAAESLAGGRKVDVQHVATVIELRNPKGSSPRKHMTETAQAAEKELAALSAALAKAKRGNPEDAAAVLAAALSSPAIAKLGLMTRAFPGLRDRAIEPARKAMLEVPSVAPRPTPSTKGASTHVYVAGEGGQPVSLQAEYRLVEASKAIASHDPTTFSKRADYPEGVQERAYHRDPAEQAKVIRNAQALNPAFVINTNPDAVNGPPIMDETGAVLGGNSRTMSMQLAYAKHPEKAAAMKKYMAAHAHEVGLKASDVEAMDNPILMRVVKTPPSQQSALVRQMNESFTQSMDPRTMQVALGRKLDDQALQSLADHMEPDETLNKFLSTSRADSFINALMRTGVIDQRNANQYMVKGTRTLNEDGKTLVARILVGRTVGDADLLSNTSTATINNLARSVPLMAQATRAGDGYDLSSDLRIALEAYNDLQHRAAMGHRAPLSADMSQREFDGLFSQMDMFAAPEDNPVVQSPRAMTLLEVLIRKNGPQKMAAVFQEYSVQSSRNPEGQVSIFGATETPTQILQRVVADSLKKSVRPRLMLRVPVSRQPRLGIRVRPGTV